MALSGSLKTNTGVALNLRLDWSATQNIQNNTSTVTANLYLVHKSITASAVSGSYISVNGSSSNYSKTVSTSSNTETSTLLTTKTVTVNHNQNGEATCALAGTFIFNGTYSGKYIGTLSVSQTVTLDTIPRASSLSIPASVNTGSSFTVTITKANSSYRHRVELLIDGAQKYISDYFTATSASYSVAHSWLPNSTSKSMTVKLYTYTSSGTTAIGITTSIITVNVPSNIVPSISISGALISGLDGYYVQGKSSIKITATGEPGSGATIASYTFYGPNINGSNSSVVQTSNTRTSSIISTDGNKSYYVRITDSRGRYVDSNIISATVYPYAAPSIKVSSIQRCLQSGVLDKSGTYAKYSISGDWASVNGKNTRTVTVAYSSDNGSTYSAESSIAVATNTDTKLSGIFGGGNFSISSSYKVRFTITDKYSSQNIVVNLGTAERPVNFAQYGNGVSIGGMSSVTSSSAAGLFESNWDGIFYDDLYVGSTKTLANKISGLAKCATRITSGDLNTVYGPGIYTVASSVTNVPSSAAYTVAVLPYSTSSTAAATNKYMAQIAITSGSATSNSLYVRHSYDEGQWTSWMRVAADEDSGWVALNTEVSYRKKNGWVCVVGQSSGSKKLTKGAYTTVGTLPSGSRPPFNIPFTYHCTGGSVGQISAYVDSAGKVQLYNTDDYKDYWMFSVSFPV